jgi:hypothetical protein
VVHPENRPSVQAPLATPREDPHDLEHSLRELVRNSPYVGVSLLMHALVLLVFMNLAAPIPMPDPDKPTIRATPRDLTPPIPPEPPEPLEDLQPVDQPDLPDDVAMDDPDPTLDPTDVPSDHPSDEPFDNPTAANVIGLGPGDIGRPGRGSKVGNRGKGNGGPYAQNIAAALDWLARHQHPDGHWSSEGFSDECSADAQACTGRGRVHHDVGVTGLALLAFLGAGHRDGGGGPYADVVKDGIRWLVDVQDQEGRYAASNVSTATYDHFLGTLAMVEAYALGGRNQTKHSARRAIAWAEQHRTPGGGWRYLDRNDPEMQLHPSDVSVTGWAVMALSLAKDVGLDVDPVALEDALLLVDELTDAAGRTGYVEPGSGPSRPVARAERYPADQSEAMTAVGLLCRLFLDPGSTRTDLDSAGDVDRGVDLVLGLPILWDEDQAPGRIDFYYWYAATYALFQRGGASWKRWEPGLDVVATHQLAEGDPRGSWDPSPDVWGGEGGRVYSTALLTLMLQVHTRYAKGSGMTPPQDKPRKRR